MKDILDHLNEMFDTVYNSATGRRTEMPDSGDADLDRAWQDLDSFMKSNAGPRPANAFQDMDQSFAEFDRRFSAGGSSAKPNANFDELKSRARAQAESNQKQREQSESRSNFSGSKPATDPLEQLARELVRDYHNLEIKPGAPLEEVKAAYKKLLKQYHPDRFANDQTKQATATQITARLNQSYARIMEHLGQK